jgi:hypothetical protein
MICPKCGASNDHNAYRCEQCQSALQPAPPSPFLSAARAPQRPAGAGDDPSMRYILPIGRSGLAIIAGYLGLLSLFLPIGPFAIVAGVLALRDIKAHPEKLGRGRAIFALVAGGIATALLLVIFLPAAFR